MKYHYKHFTNYKGFSCQLHLINTMVQYLQWWPFISRPLTFALLWCHFMAASFLELMELGGGVWSCAHLVRINSKFSMRGRSREFPVHETKMLMFCSSSLSLHLSYVRVLRHAGRAFGKRFSQRILINILHSWIVFLGKILSKADLTLKKSMNRPFCA